MEMFLKRCESSDLDFNKITEFYKYVINNTKGMSECGRWIYQMGIRSAPYR